MPKALLDYHLLPFGEVVVGSHGFTLLRDGMTYLILFLILLIKHNQYCNHSHIAHDKYNYKILGYIYV